MPTAIQTKTSLKTAGKIVFVNDSSHGELQTQQHSLRRGSDVYHQYVGELTLRIEKKLEPYNCLQKGDQLS